MPEITIYTNDGDCANSVAELNPFTVGDTTNDWTLKFVNEDGDFYAPSNVTMRVGHTNGLPDGTYNNAFKWVDRADNESTGSIVVSSGVPTLSFNVNPIGGVVGTNGVYILRGPKLDGSITSVSILANNMPSYLFSYKNYTRYATITGNQESTGSSPAVISYTLVRDDNIMTSGSEGTFGLFYYKNNSTGRYWTTAPSWETNRSGIPSSASGAVSSGNNNLEGTNFLNGAAAHIIPSNQGSKHTTDFIDLTGDGGVYAGTSGTLPSLDGTFILTRAKLNTITLVSGGSGYTGTPVVSLNEISATPSGFSFNAILPNIDVKVAVPRYEFPFKRNESGNDIIAATTLSPYSDGEVDTAAQYDHSTLVIRPETVATASLTQSGTDWVGTMDPVNAYVTERLALRNSTQLDLQIRGDGRTLFQGQLTVLNKIA
jgi:hypothetical protein